MKSFLVVSFFVYLNHIAYANGAISAPLEGFERYLPGVSVKVSEEARGLVPLIFEAFESLEPLREPIDGGSRATFFKKIFIVVGNELKLVKIYEEKYVNSVANLGFGISGTIEYELTIPVNVTFYDLEIFIKRNFKEKLVRPVIYKWYHGEWKCRLSESELSKKSLYESAKEYFFNRSCLD
ncbi:MAG: hypothetical protein H6625_09870 [Bdellovibrionaceae bacterium]|nr:hypothetical protein [Pseudobdellovibrionaceae bacterium]